MIRVTQLSMYEQIPLELKKRPQWVLWKLEKRNGVDTKVPYAATGDRADSSNPSTWTSFQDALSALQRSSGQYNGLGYVFSADDPFTGIDLDSDSGKGPFCCMHDEGMLGELTDEASAIIDYLDSYAEYSQSGTGVHIIVEARKLPGWKSRTGNFEIYDSGRFFVMTGDHLEGTPKTVEPRQAEVEWVYELFFGKPKQEEKERGPEQIAPLQSPPMDDNSVLSIAQKAANGSKFSALYAGDWSVYGSQSEADQALCNLLAFYTQDPGQIDRLFQQSGLYREKWDRDDYKWATVWKAITDLSATYKGDAAPRTDHEFDTGDKGNAERFIFYYEDVMRHCSSMGGWLIWDGRRWKQDDEGEAIRKALTIPGKIEQEEYFPIWNGLSENEQMIIQTTPKKDLPPELLRVKAQLDALRAQAEKAKSERGVSAMLKLAAAYLSVRPEELDADHWVINVNNGILDLRTGVLHPHDPARLMTKLAPVTYDPSAACPLWEKSLREIFEDENGNTRPDELRFLQKSLGYALTGSIKEHAFFIIHGRRGRNGKGLIFNTAAKILGDYVEQINANVLLAKKFDSSGEGPSPGIAKLKGARLVLASETDRGRRLDEALIKGLTGGDPITARFLHQNEMTFEPTFKIFLQTNYAPNVDGSDQGIWDRIRKLDFLRYFSEKERDTQLPEKLLAESAGIFRWMVEGCFMWKREGLPETEGTRQAKAEFLDEVDAIPRYAQSKLWFHPTAMVNPVDLYRDYEDWCYLESEYTHKRKEFLQRLEAHMARDGHLLRKNQRDPTGTRRVHKGVGFIGQMKVVEGRDISVIPGQAQ